jgi:hypothetical protein
VEENITKELIQLVDFEEERQYEEASENEHVEENVAEELVHLVDLKRRGSVRRLQRMNV